MGILVWGRGVPVLARRAGGAVREDPAPSTALAATLAGGQPAAVGGGLGAVVVCSGVALSPAIWTARVLRVRIRAWSDAVCGKRWSGPSLLLLGALASNFIDCLLRRPPAPRRLRGRGESGVDLGLRPRLPLTVLAEGS